MILGDKISRPEHDQPQQLGSLQTRGASRHSGSHHLEKVVEHQQPQLVRVAPRQTTPQHVPPLLPVRIAQRERGEKAVPQAGAGANCAHRDATGAHLPGRHAHRLVQFQPGHFLVVRHSDGGAELPNGRHRAPPEHGHVRTKWPLRLRAQAERDVRPQSHDVPALQPVGQGVRRAALVESDPARHLRPVRLLQLHVQRSSGSRADRYTGGQLQAEDENRAAQLAEPGVERYVLLSGHVSRPDLRTVQRDRREHQPHNCATRHSAETPAPRLQARALAQ